MAMDRPVLRHGFRENVMIYNLSSALQKARQEILKLRGAPEHQREALRIPPAFGRSPSDLDVSLPSMSVTEATEQTTSV